MIEQNNPNLDMANWEINTNEANRVHLHSGKKIADGQSGESDYLFKALIKRPSTGLSLIPIQVNSKHE